MVSNQIILDRWDHQTMIIFIYRLMVVMNSFMEYYLLLLLMIAPCLIYLDL
jgi:hypothetical protein